MTYPSNAQDAYRLFGRLLLHGVTPGVVPSLKKNPVFAGFFPHANIPPDKAAIDDWAAQHFDLFGMNVYPNASIFLDPSGMFGGTIPGHVTVFYENAGYLPTTGSEDPDHIGHELGFLAHLEGRRSEARKAGDTNQLESLAETRRRFFHEHLLLWLPLFLKAIDLHGIPFYCALAAEIRRQIRNDAPAWENSPELPVLPEPETYAQLLTRSETRLRDIAAYLLSPVRTGYFLSRERISAFGRSTRLPRGFGERLQILTNLMHAASDYDLLDGVLDLIDAEINLWEMDYHEMQTSDPVMGPVAGRWLVRTRETRRLLSEMRKELV